MALIACDKNPETFEEASKYVKLSGQCCKATFSKKDIVRTVSKHYDAVFLIVINLVVLLNVSLVFRGYNDYPIVIKIRCLVTKVSLCQKPGCFYRVRED